MAHVVPGRMTANIDGDFVVFMIGMRFNKKWKIHKWLPMMSAMPRMMKELYADPNSGLLGHTLAMTGSGTLTVQYWRTVEQLEKFARDPRFTHRPAWKAYNKAVGGSGDVGVWHETYLVSAGHYETLYANMPRFGLAQAGEHLPVARKGETAATRRGAPTPTH
ncbi:DUF4188 domain-containing protein [Hamadaea tsunoensis]|uniref:DUF4188 domain-containing protein n=1 Tax=Hamadaea tsunoensis TaxID=53368 RepID=UPI0004854133|nr:DUF4188 domain-containing protein [Hamadaea tsunoensis]